VDDDIVACGRLCPRFVMSSCRLPWQENNSAVVCDDLETQRREGLSARFAYARKVHRACALVTFDTEADVNVPLQHFDRAVHPGTAVEVPRGLRPHRVAKHRAHVLALSQLAEHTAHRGARQAFLVRSVRQERGPHAHAADADSQQTRPGAAMWREVAGLRPAVVLAWAGGRGERLGWRERLWRRARELVRECAREFGHLAAAREDSCRSCQGLGKHLAIVGAQLLASGLVQ